ncbi:hypothetical protein QTA56_03465 [Acinetobacter sp. VNH17]|uniref:Uncharacterized protein n=1 Tax=Acinetobacter thutiue TaxID=2998078 RepID=A0ABT7WKV0_9GAMM|nr:hypothetical protein [Acinetobacter thutiue]MCY6411197.1 hypothetical protein [Acinetobacter thutiue]MDN0013299.1 hypothetical protein [Acinetobacter thutiue]
MKNFFNYTPKNQTKVDGKMTAKDSGVVGKINAYGDLLFKIGLVISMLLIAFTYFYVGVLK